MRSFLYTLGFLFVCLSVTEAAEEYPGRRAGIRLRRYTDLTAEQITLVVEGGCLRGRDRKASMRMVYANLYSGYATREPDDEGQVSRLLNLAKLIHDKAFEEPGGFFDTLDNLKHYVCEELARCRKNSTTSGADKTQMAFREAHLCLQRARNGNSDLLGRAYELFGEPLTITKNKYGLPWQAEIIVEDRYDAGSATREGSLHVARMALMKFSRYHPLRPKTAQEESLMKRINEEIGPVSPSRDTYADAGEKKEEEARRASSPVPSGAGAASAVAGGGAGASGETPSRPKPLTKEDSKRRAQAVEGILKKTPTSVTATARRWDWDRPDEAYKPSSSDRRTRRRMDERDVDMESLHSLVASFGDRSAASIAAELGMPRALVEEARRFTG